MSARVFMSEDSYSKSPKFRSEDGKWHFFTAISDRPLNTSRKITLEEFTTEIEHSFVDGDDAPKPSELLAYDV